MSEAPPKRTTVRRLPSRGVYDRATINEILDQSLICHVGFSDSGHTFVLPKIHVCIGDTVFLHGSAASRMLRVLAAGSEACLTVALLEGLVLARSAFHHSINYRSVMLFGKGTVIEHNAEKLAVLQALTQRLIPGRWADVRQTTDKELRETFVLGIPIHEASAKVRTGPPIDDDVDYALPDWAGVIPLQFLAGVPIPDPRLRPSVEIPAYARSYSGPGSKTSV